MRLARTGPMPVDLAQPIGLGLDDVEHLLAERLDHLLGIDRADAADHARGPRYFSMPSMDVGAEVRMKRALNCWPWVRSLTHSPDGGDPFAGGDRGGVAHDGDQVAMAARLDPQNAEAVLGVVERDALDEAGEDFLGR